MAMVLTSPERINAIIIKVKKNISAVPKSFIRKSAPTQPNEKMRYLVRLRAFCSLSKDAAPTKINASFTNSDG